MGATVQVIPHITNEIKSFVYSVASETEAEVVITEVGGTTGDIESQPFLEAIRQISIEVGSRNCLLIHVTLFHISGLGDIIPDHAAFVRELQSMGYSPNIIVIRATDRWREHYAKFALFCIVNRTA